MANKYKAKFMDLSNVSYSLEIYKTYTDTIKEVILVDSPEIDCKTPDYIIDGGLCTTGVKFSLLGTNTDDLMALALSELTEYKVLIKNTDLNTVVYFGYLINGVYEIDFSLYNNYPVDFAASDFKVLEESKSCTNGLTENTLSFTKLFEKTCIYNEYKSLVNINICTSTVTANSKATDTTLISGYNASLLNSIYIDTRSLLNEKDEPINDFDILDGLLKQYGYILTQFNGELYIYEAGKSNMYNDTYKGLLSTFNSTTNISTATGVNGWLEVNVPTQVKWNDEQTLSVTEKFDKLKIKPDYNYKDNYADLRFELEEKDILTVRGDNNNYVATWTPSGVSWKVSSLYKIPNTYFDNSIYTPNTMFHLGNTNSQTDVDRYSISGSYGFANSTDRITFTPKNSYSYTSSFNGILKVKVDFKMFIKGRSPDPVSDYMGGDIVLKKKDGTVLASKRYVCFNDDTGSDIIYRALVMQASVFDESKNNSNYTVEEKKEFIFDIPYTTNDVENIIVEFRKPYFTQHYADIPCTDFWGVADLDISFVYKNVFSNKWEKYEEEKPQEIIVESTTLTNNISKTETFDYNYISNDKSYPLVANALYDKGTSSNLTYLKTLCKNRTSKLNCAGWETLENINIDILFKQLNVRRLKLEAGFKFNNLIAPNKYYKINTIPNKYFIVTGYSYDISDTNIKLTLEEFIK